LTSKHFITSSFFVGLQPLRTIIGAFIRNSAFQRCWRVARA